MTYTATELLDSNEARIPFGWEVTQVDAAGKPIGKPRKVFVAPVNDTAQGAIDVVTAPPPPPPDPLEVFRSSAVLPKFDFLTAARRAQIITNADYLKAASGGWPDAFAAALDAMSEDEQVEAQGLWAMTTEVRRNADLITAIIAAPSLDITEETVDALFGWNG